MSAAAAQRRCGAPALFRWLRASAMLQAVGAIGFRPTLTALCRQSAHIVPFVSEATCSAFTVKRVSTYAVLAAACLQRRTVEVHSSHHRRCSSKRQAPCAGLQRYGVLPVGTSASGLREMAGSLLRNTGLEATPSRRAKAKLDRSGQLSLALSAVSFEECCSLEPALLRTVRARTVSEMPQAAHMMSGPQQGRFLFSLARLARSKRILEIGSFTGYATVWLASALPPDGKLVACEHDDNVVAVAQAHLEEAKLRSRVDFRLGDALQTVRELAREREQGAEVFDLIFLDADKRRMVEYYQEVLAGGLLAPDGLLIADNILWKWQVLPLPWEGAPPDAPDRSALPSRERRLLAIRDALHTYNVALAADDRVDALVMPLRDGLSIAQLKANARHAVGEEAASSHSAVADASTLTEHSDATGLSYAPGKQNVLRTAKSEDALLRRYLSLAGGDEPAAMKRLRAETERLDAGLALRSLIGPHQGRLLHMLVRASRATAVLSVGSATGYVTMWLAAALRDGLVVTCEADKVATAVAKRHLRDAGLEQRVQHLHSFPTSFGDHASGSLAGPCDPDSQLTGAGHQNLDDQFDLAVLNLCGVATDSTKKPFTQRVMELMPTLKPTGLAVVLTSTDSPDAFAALRELAELKGLGVVTLPSPDGMHVSLTLVGLPSDLDANERR